MRHHSARKGIKMSQFDTTATIIGCTGYKVGRAEESQAPVIDCFDGEIIAGERHAAPCDTSDRFFEDGPVRFDAPGDAVCAALMSLHEALIDDVAVFDQGSKRSFQSLDIEMIAAHGRGATFLVMRLRHAPAPL
jgi:hypothetical protein